MLFHKFLTLSSLFLTSLENGRFVRTVGGLKERVGFSNMTVCFQEILGKDVVESKKNGESKLSNIVSQQAPGNSIS